MLKLRNRLLDEANDVNRAIEELKQIKIGKIIHKVVSNIKISQFNDCAEKNIEDLYNRAILSLNIRDENLLKKEYKDNIIENIKKILQMLKNNVGEKIIEELEEIDILDIYEGELRINRPDKIIVKRDEIVIIDYKLKKTREKEAIEKYHSQMIRYMDLVKKIFKKPVKGLIVYMEENELERIENGS